MFTVHPDPESVGVMDAPPAALLEQFVPELTGHHNRVGALLNAARDAGVALERLNPPRGALPGTAGAEWAEARRKDTEAVRNGKAPVALSKVMQQFPARYGTAMATATVAAGAVREWNSTARDAITAKTRARVQAAEEAARGDAITAAARAQVDADLTHPTDANRRLEGAWSALSAMDEALVRWRPAHQVLAWVNGQPWRAPWPGMRPEVEVIHRAMALRDENLRREFTRIDAVPKVPQVS